MGVRPMMQKLYDGKNVAVRPIPIVVDSSDARAIAAAAGDQKPLGAVVNMPAKPRPTGADTIFGTPVARSAKVGGAVYDPMVGIENIL
jgi:hypothetical protein